MADETGSDQGLVTEQRMNVGGPSMMPTVAPAYPRVVHPNEEQIVLASGANLILGLWLIAAPFVLTYASATPRGNDIILGIAIGVIAAMRVFGAYRAAWLSWLNVLLGLWLLIAPFGLGYTHLSHPMWNDIIVGVLVIIFALWSSFATHGKFRKKT